MKSITIHGIDDELAGKLTDYAKEKNTSLNKSIKELLSRSLGLPPHKKKYADFSKFCGVWSAAEAAAFDANTADLENIDEKDWK